MRFTYGDSNLGKVLLPLRLFMGVTFTYAGLLKLASADYLNPEAPNGVLKQMQLALTDSPIAFVLNHAIEHASLAGIAIAVGELFAGLGILFGIWVRFAAAGAFVLSFSFLLTVSWGTYPYFFGPDIVFMAGLTPLMIAGDGRVWSVESFLRQRAAHQVRSIDSANFETEVAEQAIARRTVIQSGVAAGGLGFVGLLAGVVGKKFNSSNSRALPSATPSTSASVSSSTSPAGQLPNGVKVATVADVPVGSAFQFVDPSSGGPAYLLQPKSGTFLAYSALCTHEGCQVNFAQTEFACPCHGATFSVADGSATRGPARDPLQALRVEALGNDLYIV